MVDIILQLKPPYDEQIEPTMALLAQQAIELFGTGGNPSADAIEGYLGYVNTPVLGGYVRVRVAKEYATVIEQIGENDAVRLVRVEWEEPEGGWEPIFVETPDGVQEIGRIS